MPTHMLSTCLIGCEPGVAVQPIWPDRKYNNLFLQTIRDWGDLTEVELLPGETVLKLSRHVYDRKQYTWMGLYSYALPYGAKRLNTFIGAGFFLEGRETFGANAGLSYLENVLHHFIVGHVHDGQLAGPVSEISPESFTEPKGLEVLEASINTVKGGVGLSSMRKPAKTGRLFVDIGAKPSPEFIARDLARAQIGPEFQNYHTLLVGRPPVEETDRRRLVKFDVMSHDEVLALEPKLRTRAGKSAPSVASRTPLPVGKQSDPRLLADQRRDIAAALDGQSKENSKFFSGVIVGIGATALFFLLLMAIDRFGAQQSGADRAGANVTASMEPGASPTASIGIDSYDQAGARKVVDDYFARIKAGQTTKALAMWSPEVRPAVTAGELSQTMRRYSEYQATTEIAGPPEVSRDVVRIKVPVQISGRFDDQNIDSTGIVTLEKRLADSGADWMIAGFEISKQLADPVVAAGAPPRPD